MLKQMYSIYDEKAKFYSQPVNYNSPDDASRMMYGFANDERSPYSSRPSDFKVYHMGTFDDCSGELVSKQPPEFFAELQQFVYSNQ